MLTLVSAPPAPGSARPRLTFRDDGAVGPPPTTGPGPFPLRRDAATFLRWRDAGRFPEGVELLDGIVLHRDRRDGAGPIETVGPRHAGVVTRLSARSARPCWAGGCHVRTDGPLFLSGYDVPLPDVAVVRGRAAAYRDRPPGPADVPLVVEVASAGPGFDRSTKSRVYASAGVEAYWLLDAEAGLLEQRDQPDAAGGHYRRLVTLELDRDEAFLPLPGVRPPLPLAGLLN